MTFKKYDIVRYDENELSVMRITIVTESGKVFGTHLFGMQAQCELCDLIDATEEEKEVYRLHERNRRVPALDHIRREALDWQRITFPNATSDTCLAHLKSEMAEFLDSGDPVELADVFFLTIAYLERMDIDFAEVLQRKLLICYDREWETKVNEAGYFGHKK